METLSSLIYQYNSCWCVRVCLLHESSWLIRHPLRKGALWCCVYLWHAAATGGKTQGQDHAKNRIYPETKEAEKVFPGTGQPRFYCLRHLHLKAKLMNTAHYSGSKPLRLEPDGTPRRTRMLPHPRGEPRAEHSLNQWHQLPPQQFTAVTCKWLACRSTEMIIWSVDTP